jgi:hypothetical protein
MLPRFHFIIAAILVTVLLVFKLGAELAVMLSRPYIAPPDFLQVRPQTFATERRTEELHRLLELPVGVITSFADTSHDGSPGAITPITDSDATISQPVRMPLTRPDMESQPPDIQTLTATATKDARRAAPRKKRRSAASSLPTTEPVEITPLGRLFEIDR